MNDGGLKTDDKSYAPVRPTAKDEWLTLGAAVGFVLLAVFTIGIFAILVLSAAR